MFLRGGSLHVLIHPDCSSLLALMLNMQQAWNVVMGSHGQIAVGQEVTGKFGGANAEQKERNLASSLGSERFLLAFSRNVSL